MNLFSRAGDAAKLPDAITLYSLRHTFATLSLAGGVDAKTVADALGHTSTAFTLDTYTQTLSEIRRAASDKLEAMFLKSAAK